RVHLIPSSSKPCYAICMTDKRTNSRLQVQLFAAALAVPALIFAAGTPVFAQSDNPAGISLFNIGGDMGGHTPRGFQGQGNGIFVGDNLNRSFPNGDGVQAFISFDISGLPAGTIKSARLSSRFLRVNGEPFTDLGPIRLEQTEFSRFSSALWNSPAQPGLGCVLAISPDQTSAGCDLTAAVQGALADGRQLLQFRLRFEKISDADNRPDLALFFKQDSNTNEGGVFELTIR
ncbi:MAG: hypothetical protein ACC619_03235, partial [Paracoccaceae bacterium]